MNSLESFLTAHAVAALSFFAVAIGRAVALHRARKAAQYPKSSAIYYGWLTAFVTAFSAMFGFVLMWFLTFRNEWTPYIPLMTASLGFFGGLAVIRPALDARYYSESLFLQFMRLAAGLAVFTTLAIILSLLFETLSFFAHDDVSIVEFFLSAEWGAQSSTSYGAVALFFGTLFVTGIALCVAGPIGFFCAIYLSEYASPLSRRLIKPFLEILAGVPTVVYGFFAILVVSPAMQELADGISAVLTMITGVSVTLPNHPKNALGAGIVLGIMIIPYISSLSDDILRSVPRKLKTASFGLGSTTSETFRYVIFPVALPGLMGALLLAVSRAIGETMIVVMAVGQRAKLTLNPFEDVTTITAQIVSLMTGSAGTDSPRTLSAFALGAVLFAITLAFNVIAHYVVQRQRKYYAGL